MRKQFSARSLAALLGAGMLAGACLLAGCTGTASGGASSANPSSAGSNSAGRSGAGASSAPAGSGSTGSGGTGSAGTAPATTAPPASGPAAAELATTLAALKSGGAVHVDITNQTAQGTTMTYSDEATATGGRQLIATADGGHVTILYVSGITYVTGNATGLVDLMSVSENEATGLADQWISVRPGQTLGQSSFASIADGITLSSVASELQVDGPLTLTAPTTANGLRVIGVQGSAPAGQQGAAPARVTLDVLASGTPRPVLYTATASDGSTTRIAFSRWGETVSLTAPQGAISAGSLGTPILT